MTPAFHSWAEFFAMGNYAFYVWLAVAATLLSLLGLLMHTLWQHKQLLADIHRRQAREQRIRQAQLNQTSLHQSPLQQSPLHQSLLQQSLLQQAPQHIANLQEKRP
ncbi:heme exporter protein CcmD [Yersinia pseudotuberculosis]|uniref:Heme exporter protein D n=1 Tax=Yersinia pseudotuberculosis TaxID=633 RepID=A0A0T9JD19_YERPU|nr:heme exporter protein CcmD [Yersinia pseudotuberculosis]PSH19654.1 heme exporter protein CcmD [Yersinia pseudotuberculosis]CNC36366.1 heme exporter protein D [Yersinia pseudotuberculosis]SUP84333.1 heme exporter protein D [Yersinia pseudotuberculosis]